MPVARLPTELYENTIDWLKNDIHAIRQCTLVSKAWHARAQMWLYRTIEVIDDVVGDFDYIRRSTPYITMRMRNFVPFVESAHPASVHLRRLRIACFWHNDEASWSEYVSTWLEMQLVAHLSIDHLQVYVQSQQNMGSLLQALALHFPNVTSLDLHGTFAEPSDMATCINSFPRIRSLRVEWDGSMRSALREVWLASPRISPRPAFSACRITVDKTYLPFILRWVSEDHARVQGIVVDKLSPARHDYDIDQLENELIAMQPAEQNLIKGLHMSAADGGTVSTASWRRVQRAINCLPKLAYVKISTTYGVHTESEEQLRGTRAVPGSYAYDPIHQIVNMFTLRWGVVEQRTPYKAPSIEMVVIELKLPAADMAVLLHHNWKALDRTFAGPQWKNIYSLVISVCFTECDDVTITHAAERFIRSRVRACDAIGILSVRTSHVPPQSLKKRKFMKEGTIPTEEGFVRFARTDFPSIHEFSRFQSLCIPGGSILDFLYDQ